MSRGIKYLDYNLSLSFLIYSRGKYSELWNSEPKDPEVAFSYRRWSLKRKTPATWSWTSAKPTKARTVTKDRAWISTAPFPRCPADTHSSAHAQRSAPRSIRCEEGVSIFTVTATITPRLLAASKHENMRAVRWRKHPSTAAHHVVKARTIWGVGSIELTRLCCCSADVYFAHCEPYFWYSAVVCKNRASFCFVYPDLYQSQVHICSPSLL